MKVYDYLILATFKLKKHTQTYVKPVERTDQNYYNRQKKISIAVYIKAN